MNTGERVGAILSAKNMVVRFLGFGTFEGAQVPPHRKNSMATLMHECGVVNPQIRLDSGKLVFGAECWWGSESAIQSQLDELVADGYEVVNTDIDEVLGIAVTTNAEAVAYLKAKGLNAQERTWTYGDSVMVLIGPIDANEKIKRYRDIYYITKVKDREFHVFSMDTNQTLETLQLACDSVVEGAKRYAEPDSQLSEPSPPGVPSDKRDS